MIYDKYPIIGKIAQILTIEACPLGCLCYRGLGLKETTLDIVQRCYSKEKISKML